MEDKTSQNDVLEANNSYGQESITDSSAETAEATKETELETEQTDSDGSSEVTLTRAELDEREREIRKEQDRRWKERIKGLEGKEGGQEGRQEGQKSNSPQEGVASKEELDRLRLEHKGVESKEQQDFVLKYAKVEGLGVLEALDDDVVKVKLEKLSVDEEKGRATQTPVNRTGKPREKTPQELARLAEEKGFIPQTKEERKAQREALQAKFGRTNG